jgi:hypothetical protein
MLAVNDSKTAVLLAVMTVKLQTAVMLAVMTVKLRTGKPEGKDRCSTEQDGLSLATEGPLPHNPPTSGTITLEKQVCKHVTNTFSFLSCIRTTQRI